MLIDFKAPFIAADIPLPLSYYGSVCYFSENGSQTAGSACDYNLESKISAMGEYLEREFLYHAVPLEGYYSYAELTPEEAAVMPFLDAFEGLEYVTVRAWNEKYRIRVPRSVIYLNSDNDRYTHFRDSSGCALGPTLDYARTSACLEFIERQSLIISWHTQTYHSRVANKDLLYLCDGMRRKLCERFLRSGEVTAVLNTIPGASCYSGIILYRSKRDVKYAVSSGCALSLQSLINKLVGELWQSYLFIYNNVNVDNIIERDYYKANFLSMNQYKTADLWGVQLSALPLVYVEKCQLYSEEDFYQSLTTFDVRFYLYEQKTHDDFHFCKLISPDFFPHMSVAHTEVIPDYCRHVFNINAMRELEIPFP